MAVVGHKPDCVSLDSLRNGDPWFGLDRVGNF